MPESDKEKPVIIRKQRTIYSGQKNINSWREFFLKLGKDYAVGKADYNTPLWLKTRDIFLIPGPEVQTESVKYIQQVMINFLQNLRNNGFMGDIEVKLEDPPQNSNFKALLENPDRNAAYAYIAHDDLVAYGMGVFETGIIDLFTNTRNKEIMNYTSSHELSHLLTPSGFAHCEEHPLIRGYSRNRFCVLSISAYGRTLKYRDGELPKPNLTLCDQCSDGMNYFWKGIMENIR